MIFILQEDSSTDYKNRTEVNAMSADVTFAIARDFSTAGEKLTKTLAQKHGKLYIPISPEGDVMEKAKKVVNLLNETFVGKKHTISFNIAGNGLYTMKGAMTQKECDEFTYSLLWYTINNKNFKLKVGKIRSGGQTGFDEAGIKAGIKLKIDTTAFYPKGFRIRDLDGDKYQTRKEVYKRLDYKQRKKVFVDMDNVLCDFVKSYLQWKKEHPQIEYPQSQFGFFSNLEPVPGAIEGFKKLQEHYEVYILTRPSVYNLMCYTEKADWIKRHLGFEVLENLIIMCNKSLVEAKGAYLIDDDIQAGQMDFEGEFIHFKTEKFPDWNTVIKHLIKDCNLT
jgi:5'(3')-deoxyribonucleotidase